MSDATLDFWLTLGPEDKLYTAGLDKTIAARIAQWKARPGDMLLYPAMKQLTLDLAATSFLGADIGPEVDDITRAFVDMIAAAVAVIRKPLPGTKMARGVAGRKRIAAYFAEQIPARRAKGGGDDLFSQLCRATLEVGDGNDLKLLGWTPLAPVSFVTGLVVEAVVFAPDDHLPLVSEDLANVDGDTIADDLLLDPATDGIGPDILPAGVVDQGVGARVFRSRNRVVLR